MAKELRPPFDGWPYLTNDRYYSAGLVDEAGALSPHATPELFTILSRDAMRIRACHPLARLVQKAGALSPSLFPLHVTSEDVHIVCVEIFPRRRYKKLIW